MPTTSTSFRTDPETLSSLDAVAQGLGRSRNWVLNQAVRDFLERQAWYRRQVEEGIAAADKGKFATDEEMAALFDRFGA